MPNYSENREIRGRFSSTAQQRLDESRCAACLQDNGTRAIFSEDFSSIRSVLSSPLESKENKKSKTKKNSVVKLACSSVKYVRIRSLLTSFGIKQYPSADEK